MKKIVLLALITLFETQTWLLAGEPRLVIVPQSTTLASNGNVKFAIYLFNDSDRKITAPAPEAGFTVFWTLRDVDNIREPRENSHLVLGTDTEPQHTLGPQTAARCDVGDKIFAEPGDILEFYITVESKGKSGKGMTIRSNSVLLFRQK